MEESSVKKPFTFEVFYEQPLQKWVDILTKGLSVSDRRESRLYPNQNKNQRVKTQNFLKVFLVV